MFSVYILHSPSHNKIYIGFTPDMDNRLRSHNIYASKGWTIKFRPWILVYKEEFVTKSEAMQREKNLKGAKGRMEIWNIIKEQRNG